MDTITFHNYKPQQLSLFDAVVTGLSQPHKMIPPKFFYDERGSKLFDAICEQPEYYLPAAEQALLHARVDDIAALTGQNRVVIEPGAGSMTKIRLLTDQLQPSAYVPMDISCEYLQWAAQDLSNVSPWLHIHAACVDFTHSIPIPGPVPAARRLAFFPGSSLGNFHRYEALKFLTMVRNVVGKDGMLLIGVDTKKPAQILDAAYNDAAGVTAAFNLNLLQRICRELGAECDLDAFTHHAFYNAEQGRIEMHLVSQCEQELRINGHCFHFEAGESVHTECSYKYSPDEFLALAAEAGFRPVKSWLAEGSLFGVYLLAVA
jgi:dimethylhistidine N-methyltransferase